MVTTRNQIILDTEGNILNNFVISYNSQEGKFECPTIYYNVARECYSLDITKRDNAEIMFDPKLPFIPFTEYINGNLIIEYLLNQNTLEAKQPTLKCNIIEARNALKLRESDVHYFYKPNQIGFNKDVKYMEGDLEWSCECYEMIYKIPPGYTIPNSINFTFKEYCFGNKWSLVWNGSCWKGDNIQGRKNPRVTRKCNMRNQKDAYGATGCYCMVKNDDWNRRHIPSSTNGLAWSLLNDCNTNGKYQTKILFNDGSTVNGSEYELSIVFSGVLRGASYEGYDLVSVNAIYQNYSTNKLRVSDINALYLDLTQPGESEANRLSFSVGEVHEDDVYNRGHIDILGVNDTIEVVGGVYSKRSVNIETSKDVILYLHKDYVDPIDEVNWDPETNAFTYIIQQQYYEITPNPNGATTLYTDFNITSSKIITADNITTMRSDLNVVTNTVDVVSYDVKDIKLKVDVLNSEMAETKKVTQHLQEDIDNVRVISNVALAFGVIGTVGSISSIGMQLASNGISFATKAGYSMLSKCSAEPLEHEMSVEAVNIFSSTILRARAITVDLTPILTWCNSDYSPLADIPYEDEVDNPKTTATSLYTTLDICNRFRDSLKPAFKMLVNKVEEITSEIENIDISDQIATLKTKLNDYVSHDELVRDDIIDIFPKVDNQNHILTFEFEGDTLYDGLLVFKIYSGAMISQMLRRLYIKIADGQIVDYKGVQDSQITIDGITIEPAAKSEDDRIEYIPTAELDVDSRKKFIKIPIIDPTVKIAGAVIEQNTFKRQMVYTTNDIAYLQDINALNKKIDALAEQSHMNDVQTFSMQDEFATITEVNDVLKNYVQTKDLPPTADLAEYAKLTEIPVIVSSLSDTKNVVFLGSEMNDENIHIHDWHKKGEEYCKKCILHILMNPLEDGTDMSGDYTINRYADFDFVNIEDSNKILAFNPWKDKSKCNVIIRVNNVVKPLINYTEGVFNLATLTLPYEVSDKDVPSMNLYQELQTENEELKAKITLLEQENTSLKKQVYSLTPKYPWSTFYKNYEEITYLSGYPICHYFFYTYNPTNGTLTINFSSINGHTFEKRNYLCVLIVNNPAAYYVFRISLTDKKVYVNEYKGGTQVIPFTTYSISISQFAILEITSTNTSIRYRFDYVFWQDTDS